MPQLRQEKAHYLFRVEERRDEEVMVLSPRLPRLGKLYIKNGEIIEDKTTPRIPVCLDLVRCCAAIEGLHKDMNTDHVWGSGSLYVSYRKLRTHVPTQDLLPDVSWTNERWVLDKQVRFKRVFCFRLNARCLKYNSCAGHPLQDQILRDLQSKYNIKCTFSAHDD